MAAGAARRSRRRPIAAKSMKQQRRRLFQLLAQPSSLGVLLHTPAWVAWRWPRRHPLRFLLFPGSRRSFPAAATVMILATGISSSSRRRRRGSSNLPWCRVARFPGGEARPSKALSTTGRSPEAALRRRGISLGNLRPSAALRQLLQWPHQHGGRLWTRHQMHTPSGRQATSALKRCSSATAGLGTILRRRRAHLAAAGLLRRHRHPLRR